MCSFVGGLGAGLYLVYRTFRKPGAFGNGWWAAEVSNYCNFPDHSLAILADETP